MLSFGKYTTLETLSSGAVYPKRIEFCFYTETVCIHHHISLCFIRGKRGKLQKKKSMYLICVSELKCVSIQNIP